MFGVDGLVEESEGEDGVHGDDHQKDHTKEVESAEEADGAITPGGNWVSGGTHPFLVGISNVDIGFEELVVVDASFVVVDEGEEVSSVTGDVLFGGGEEGDNTDHHGDSEELEDDGEDEGFLIVDADGPERETEGEATEDGPGPRWGEDEHVEEAESTERRDAIKFAQETGVSALNIVDLSGGSKYDGHDVSGEEGDESDSRGDDYLGGSSNAEVFLGGASFNVFLVWVSAFNAILGHFVAALTLAACLPVIAAVNFILITTARLSLIASLLCGSRYAITIGCKTDR
jgi:hypothetical protein